MFFHEGSSCSPFKDALVAFNKPMTCFESYDSCFAKAPMHITHYQVRISSAGAHVLKTGVFQKFLTYGQRTLTNYDSSSGTSPKLITHFP